MKKLLLLFISVSFLKVTFSQDKEVINNIGIKNFISIYSGFGFTQPVSFSEPLEDNWYHGKESFSFGLNYIKILSERVAINVGINYSKYKVKLQAPDDFLPKISPITESFSRITFPILTKIYFVKKFYVSFGPTIDWNLPKESDWLFDFTQSGFGFNLNVGKEFIFNKIIIDVTSSNEIHSLIPFKPEKNQQRLLVFGLRAGINFKIN